jgi:hypothetical protein
MKAQTHYRTDGTPAAAILALFELRAEDVEHVTLGSRGPTPLPYWCSYVGASPLATGFGRFKGWE